MAKSEVYTMTKRFPCVTSLAEWQALALHHPTIAQHQMRDWFKNEPDRYSRYSIQVGSLLLDYSRNRINDDTIAKLCQLASACSLSDRIHDLFSGENLNSTEHRAVLHTALRDPNHTTIKLNGHDIAADIKAALSKMRDFTQKITSGKWLGATGKPIEHIVTIGVGGSYLGTMMCCSALKDFANPRLRFYFASTVDHALLQDVLEQIDPETTLFIVSSKTFTTLETMTNARTLYAYMQQALGMDDLTQHFIAVTAVAKKAQAFGIAADNIFPLWDFVGGRYSVWSTVGLPLMLMIGADAFDEFLAGAHEMDEHFRTAPFDKNIPVLLALLSIWYRNFFNTSAQAIIPYAHRLRDFVPYLQQADMESNGKGVNLNNDIIDYATGPVIFGEEGCNGQHSYHQLLHQGKHLIPVDFILTGASSTCAMPSAIAEVALAHQEILLASGLSQAQALMLGKTYQEAKVALSADIEADKANQLAMHQSNPGNRPSNVIFLDALTPKSLGHLLAMYEHKIFTQGIIWNINSFDQWGVELGKQLLPHILTSVKHDQMQNDTDCATAGLIAHYKKIRKPS